MPEVVLRYKLTTDDLMLFRKELMQKKTNSMYILSAICAVATAGYGIAFQMYALSVICAVIFLTAGLVYPVLLKKSMRKKYENALFQGKDTQLSIYNDHVEQIVFPEYEGAYEAEINIPNERIENVTETDDVIIFFISSVESIIFPKRAMNEEEEKVLRKVMNKRFYDVYARKKKEKNNPIKKFFNKIFKKNNNNNDSDDNN